MKYFFNLFLFSTCYFSAIAQTAITAVSTTSVHASSTFSYTNGGITYNWGLSPKDTVTKVTGFTAGGVGYSYATSLTGNVKLRRVNNALISGIFTLVWAEVVNTSATLFNIFPDYQNDEESFFNNNVYNKGTDNLFDNTSTNSNNIERLDWILSTSYSTPVPAKIGFAIFERGANGAHDPFCIAAITSLDGLGNPATYGNIVRVATGNYGDIGPSVTYRILKSTFPTNLLDAGTNGQSRGGVMVYLQDLGIAANTPIFGYSLFSSDLPLGATPANLVNFNNAAFFPTNTGNAGGIDLLAITGIFIDNTVLPIRFIDFSAVENNNLINLKWDVDNELSASKYGIERSPDGINFSGVIEILKTGNSTGAHSYSYADNISGVSANHLYYRIKQYDHDGSYYYSKTISININNKTSSVIIYPDPVKETLNVNIANTEADKGMISVISSIGEQVIQQKVQLANGNNSFTVDGVNKLSGGTYQLIIKLESGKVITKEFFKQ